MKWLVLFLTTAAVTGFLYLVRRWKMKRLEPILSETKASFAINTFWFHHRENEVIVEELSSQSIDDLKLFRDFFNPTYRPKFKMSIRLREAHERWSIHSVTESRVQRFLDALGSGTQIRSGGRDYRIHGESVEARIIGQMETIANHLNKFDNLRCEYHAVFYRWFFRLGWYLEIYLPSEVFDHPELFKTIVDEALAIAKLVDGPQSGPS